MKKLIRPAALAIALLMLLLLAACGGAPAGSGTPLPESAPAEAEDGGGDSVSTPADDPADAPPDDGQSADDPVPAPDFTLTDQNGATHTLADYKGQMVFLNFWATWCPPCRNEMPDIQQLYLDHGENAEGLVVLGVAMPLTEDNRNTQEGTTEEVADFLTENGYSYPTVMDTTGALFAEYGITAFPTTFMVDKDGNLAGYITGGISRDVMDMIIEQTEAKTAGGAAA